MNLNVECFCFKGNELGGGTLTLYSQELKLPQHTKCHRELMPYADLMNWLKAVEHDSYLKLRKVRMVSYVVSIHAVISRFFCKAYYNLVQSLLSIVVSHIEYSSEVLSIVISHRKYLEQGIL